MPTPLQLRLLHIAAKQVGLDDADYRTVLRNSGKLKGDEPSSKDLTQTGFEDVMATLEQMGYRDPHRDGTYWRDQVERRGQYASTRQVSYLRQLASESRYGLPAMCLQFSGHRTDQPEKLSPQQAHKLIEMYKDAAEREGAQPPARVPPGVQPALFAGALDAPPRDVTPAAPTAQDTAQRHAQYSDFDDGDVDGEPPF